MGLKQYQVGTVFYKAHNKEALFRRLYPGEKFNSIKALAFKKVKRIPLNKIENGVVVPINRDIFRKCPTKKDKQ